MVFQLFHLLKHKNAVKTNGFRVPWAPKTQKRNKNTCVFDALIPCAQNTSKTVAFWNQRYKTRVKLMVFALPPDQSCSNGVKTIRFLMQGPKNTIKLWVSAT